MLIFVVVMLSLWNIVMTGMLVMVKFRITTLEVDRDTTWTELDLARSEMRKMIVIKTK